MFRKMIGKSQGELPRASMTINGREVPYRCSYKKAEYETDSLDKYDRVRHNYFISCKFEEVIPLFNDVLKDMNKENKIQIVESGIVTLFFPIAGTFLAPPGELLPISMHKEELEKNVERQRKNFSDDGKVAPEGYIEDYVSVNYEEFLTEFTFNGDLAHMKNYLWKKGEIAHESLYSSMSDEERDKRFVMEDVYWKMKKVIGSTRLVKVNKERTEIIGGPF